MRDFIEEKEEEEVYIRFKLISFKLNQKYNNKPFFNYIIHKSISIGSIMELDDNNKRKIQELENEIIKLKRMVEEVNTLQYKTIVFNEMFFSHERIMKHLVIDLNNPKRVKRVNFKTKKPAKTKSSANTNTDALYSKGKVHCYLCRCETQKLVENGDIFSKTRDLSSIMTQWSNITSLQMHLLSKECSAFKLNKSTNQGIKELKLFLEENKSKLHLYFIPYHFQSKYKLNCDAVGNKKRYFVEEYKDKSDMSDDIPQGVRNMYEYDSIEWLKFANALLPPVEYDIKSSKDIESLSNFDILSYSCEKMLDKFLNPNEN